MIITLGRFCLDYDLITL